MSRAPLPLRALVVAALLALGAAGCKEGDGRDGDSQSAASAREKAPRRAHATPEEREAIRAAVVRLFKSDDVRVVCEESLTPRLFRLIFTGPAACRKAAVEDGEDKPTKRVVVSAIDARGGRATARAKLIGGDNGGATGVVALKRGRAGWRTDEFSVGLLRSIVRASLRSDSKTPRSVVRCVSGRLTGLPDERFKRLAYSLIGRRPQATVRLLSTLSECERASGGVSSVRRRLEANVRKGLRRSGADGATTACALRMLQKTLPDKRLIELAADHDRRSKAQLAHAIVAAAVACGFNRGQAPGRLSAV